MVPAPSNVVSYLPEGEKQTCVNCDGSGLVPHECEFDYEIEDGR
jgi:hypothetical protein